MYASCVFFGSVTIAAIAGDAASGKSVASCASAPKILPAPLADVVRPAVIEDFIGQGSVTGQNSFLRAVLRTGEVPSLIFWGPPGCGKVRFHCCVRSIGYEEFGCDCGTLSTSSHRP